MITQASPHRSPVIALDPYVVDFYDHVNSYWLYNGSRKHEDMLLLSTGGGYRDILVRDGLTLLDEVGLYGRACPVSLTVSRGVRNNSEWRFKFEL